jgi:chromosome segregation ATPase
MTDIVTQEDILLTMDDLDRTRRALDEREAAIARRENEVDSRMDAAVDRDSSAVRLREECNLEVQRIQEATGTAVAIIERRLADSESKAETAHRAAISSAGKLEAAAGRINSLIAALTERDQWNRKIMDERESVMGRLSTAERTVAALRITEQTLTRSNDSLRTALTQGRREHEDLVRKYNALVAKIREADMARRSR